MGGGRQTESLASTQNMERRNRKEKKNKRW